MALTREQMTPKNIVMELYIDGGLSIISDDCVKPPEEVEAIRQRCGRHWSISRMNARNRGEDE